MIPEGLKGDELVDALFAEHTMRFGTDIDSCVLECTAPDCWYSVHMDGEDVAHAVRTAADHVANVLTYGHDPHDQVGMDIRRRKAEREARGEPEPEPRTLTHAEFCEAIKNSIYMVRPMDFGGFDDPT
jgi:hypothetical protein